MEYLYECPRCGEFNVHRSMKEQARMYKSGEETLCPQCGKPALHIISGVQHVMKMEPDDDEWVPEPGSMHFSGQTEFPKGRK